MILFCFFKQKTAYDMRISDWSSDVCSSDLLSSWLRQFVREARDLPFPASWTCPTSRPMPMASPASCSNLFRRERKSGVEGQSVSVRVDLGGRRSSQKKRRHNAQSMLVQHRLARYVV